MLLTALPVQNSHRPGIDDPTLSHIPAQIGELTGECNPVMILPLVIGFSGVPIDMIERTITVKYTPDLVHAIPWGHGVARRVVREQEVDRNSSKLSNAPLLIRLDILRLSRVRSTSNRADTPNPKDIQRYVLSNDLVPDTAL